MGLLDAIVESWHEATAKTDAECRKKNVLRPGSVIRDDRSTYHHYAIYAGNRQVIHFTEGKIRQTGIEDMKGRSWGFVDVMGFADQYIKDITLAQSLQRAKSCIGMTGYDLMNNNCEHFALWCRTGKAFSSQAFGSRSAAYEAVFSRNALIGSGFLELINIPSLISSIYADEVGMETLRSIDFEWLNDA